MKKFLAIMVLVVAVAACGLPAYAQEDWDKSSVKLAGECQTTGNVPYTEAVFWVENVGSAMAGETTWREYENDVFRTGGGVTLEAGEIREFRFAPEPVGAAVRFEIDQRPGHQGNSAPRLTLECQRPSAVGLTLFAATSPVIFWHAPCWHGRIEAVQRRPGGWLIGVSPDRGGLLRWFWTTRRWMVPQQVTVCGVVVQERKR